MRVVLLMMKILWMGHPTMISLIPIMTAMKQMINPDSLHIKTNCYIEKYVAELKPLSYLQFQRIGYFNIDQDSTPDHLIFNKTVGLKDTWKKK